MKKFSLLIIIISTLGILFACSNKNTADLSGKELSQKYCESCHGDELKNRGLSKTELLKVIKNGAQGMGKNIVTGSDAEKVAEYLAK